MTYTAHVRLRDENRRGRTGPRVCFNVVIIIIIVVIIIIVIIVTRVRVQCQNRLTDDFAFRPFLNERRRL